MKAILFIIALYCIVAKINVPFFKNTTMTVNSPNKTIVIPFELDNMTFQLFIIE
jgi:hypothetical protein